MLYVFLVDTGAMLTFEMELAMESVETLMKTISSMLTIPFEKQVLIMQGGEALDPSHRICNYPSAGTESNPIFLFSKTTIESPIPPSPSLNLGSETSLKEEVDVALNLPPTYETLVSRAHLASRFQEMASELSQSCISLVNEQDMQRQGWFAVISNLESIASTFKTRGMLLEQSYEEFLEIIPQYKSLLASFHDVVQLLSKLPLFSCLINNDMKTILSKEKDVTLLDWINAQDKRNSLVDMVQQCEDALEQFQKSSLLEIKEDRDRVLEDVSHKNMKEIGGLDERLNLLSRLCENACTLAQEQSDMAQGFSQNEQRWQKIGDTSVLPDLCSSHQKQLSLLMKNHLQLRDIRRRCAKAKDELSGNLHARLRWVMMIEKRICDCDNKLVMYHESMKRIKKRVEILEQVNLAPRIYALTVKEVARRRDFTSQFIKWAQSIAHNSEGIYKAEVARRREFSQFIGHHFLRNLFSGIDDMPTSFGQTSAEHFDTDLPPITSKELSELTVHMPELFVDEKESEIVGNRLPGEGTIPVFTRSRSASCEDLPIVKQFVMETSSDDVNSCGEGSATTDTSSHRNNRSRGKDLASVVQDNRLAEETSQQFEVKDRVVEYPWKTTSKTYDKSTEIQGPHSRVILFNTAVKEKLVMNLAVIRNELKELSSSVTSWQKDVNGYLYDQTTLFELRKVGVRQRRLESTRSNSESDVEELTDRLKALTKENGSLNAENESLRKELETKRKTYSEEVERYGTELERQKLETVEMQSAKERFEAEQQIRFNSAIERVMKEKEVALKKASEKLTEVKNLLSKNEEKLQVLFNEKEELRHDKEQSAKKFAEAVEEFARRETEMKTRIEETRRSLEDKEKLFAKHLESKKKEAAMMEDAEKQKEETDASGSGQIISELVVERFQKRIGHLEEENTLLKDRLKSEADGEQKILFVELQQSLDEKLKECDSLRAELELLQKKPRSSQVVYKDFQKGDIVEVYYNDKYGLHMIQTVGETLYFIHPDSLECLNLPPDQSQRSTTLQAQILDKEYCQAKKANNRFKVKVGTKFYRVKLRSWTPSS